MRDGPDRDRESAGIPGNSASGAPDLFVILPVYNEETAVAGVVRSWLPVLKETAGNFRLQAIDDGSTDSTPEVLASLKREFGGAFGWHCRRNLGHGQTCLEGYRMAAAAGAARVFQIDSDGQCDPGFFPALWAMREKADVVYGVRVRRDDGWRRTLVSEFLRIAILFSRRIWCADPNTPYRLMRCEGLAEKTAMIPPDFHLANVALAVLLREDPGWRHAFVPIHFRGRTGRPDTAKMGGFAARGVEVWRQLRALPDRGGKR